RAGRAHEADPAMRIAMGLFALACLAFGVAPVLVLRVLSGAVTGFLGSGPDLSFNWTSVSAAGEFAGIAPLWVALILALLMLAARARRVQSGNVHGYLLYILAALLTLLLFAK